MNDGYTYDWRIDVSPMLPQRVAQAVDALEPALAERLTELRIGTERPMLATDCHRDYFITADGQLSAQPSNALYMTTDESRAFMQSITRYSAYAYEDELRNGFLTLKGGYRVGIAGKTVLNGGSIGGFGSASSYCIRIPRELKGIAGELFARVREGGGLLNTLIVSPPGMGKTTLLRDLARMLSSGHNGKQGLRTCVIDERSELSGGCGSRRFDLGSRTDVLDGCPKSQGIILALRSLGPQLIVTDEIGRPEDTLALLDAINCGVGIIATAHGAGLDDLMNRPILHGMMEGNFFQLYVIINGNKGIGGITAMVRADPACAHQKAGGLS